ncbi:MAG: TIGR00269 family protein [Candidatus Micrarchaeota archaeon]|nr:TIGR00269 family protein [Candidatus Micrarchaeota archaeon]
MVKCSLCNKSAVIHLSYANSSLCEKHLIHSVERRVKRTIREYKMLDGAKHIGVAISGGKDSQVLLYILHKIAKPMRIKVTAILVDEGIEGYRDKIIPEAKKLTSDLGVPLEIVSFKELTNYSLDEIMKMQKNQRGESSCTFCGVFRRYAINKVAKMLKVDRLAIGHNLDDMVQSYMMNILRNEDLLFRFKPIGGAIEDERFVMRIRPLFRIPEKEIAVYAVLKGFKSVFVECPYVNEGLRPMVRDFVNSLESKYPGTKFKILQNYLEVSKKISDQFYSSEEGKKINSCSICGEPTSSSVCKTCSLLSKLLRKE